MIDFKKEILDRISKNRSDKKLCDASHNFLQASVAAKYSYNFTWLGRPIIQYPQDILAMQELIWKVKPDLIIETGIAHGGSLIFSASMLAQIDMYDSIKNGISFDPAKSKRKVVGIDIDIREHNLEAIESHHMFSRIHMIEGSSIDCDVINKAYDFANKYKKIMICLDSNHTHEHVLSELKAYAPLTSIGSYCVVFDTLIEDMPAGTYTDRPWDVGNNPKTAVHKYITNNNNFEIDDTINDKLLITVANNGYLKRVK